MQVMLEISQRRKSVVLYWITLLRACIALFVAVIVLFILLPGERLFLLGNLMGLFWTLNGIIILSWWMRSEKTRTLPLLAGIFGIMAGVIVFLGRPFTREAGVLILGAVIFLTGILRLLGGFTFKENELIERLKSIMALGIMEMVLGALLMSLLVRDEFWVYEAAALWLLVGSFILFSDAMAMRTRLKQLDIGETGNEHEKMTEDK